MVPIRGLSDYTQHVANRSLDLPLLSNINKCTQMKTQINITTTKEFISIMAPFSETNNTRFRSKGGKFDRASGAWVFPVTSAVTSLITTLWGMPSQLVRIKVDDSQITGSAEWMIGGYKLACRRHRDRAVEMPTGVQVEEGGFTDTGGSVKHPKPLYEGDSITLSVVVHRSFADAHGLEIVAEDTDVVSETPNRLIGFTDDELLAEITRRGLIANAA
jgi:hypothetical protein